MNSIKKQFSEQEAMALAVQEAEKSWGFVSPNPPVGCVILDKNRCFLASGFYEHYGGIHAEISALNKIKDKKALESAHLFVTLEPCAHFGQNPPCVDSLLKYPFTSLTYGREDPNPKTKNKGLKKLKSKIPQIKKSTFEQNAIRRLYEAFALNMEEQKTFFALKTASSLDGVIALNHGESQWITGKEARTYGSHLRARFDAVLIGVDTFLEDNPRLNCRKKGFEKTSNKVCLLDPSGKSLNLISKSNLASVRPIENIFVITSPSVQKKSYPFKLLSSPLINLNSPSLDLKNLSFQLYQEKIGSVLVEGGAATLSSFLEQNSAQRLYHFISPCLLGGLKGKYWTENLSSASLNDRKKLKSKEILYFAEDFFITGVL